MSGYVGFELAALLDNEAIEQGSPYHLDFILYRGYQRCSHRLSKYRRGRQGYR